MTTERFWSHVDKSARPDGCWPWTGARTWDGYGVYPRGSGHVSRAHRMAYEFMVGTIPDGLTIDHLCRNRACVNPAHLEPVTNRENVLRGNGHTAVNARKTHCIRGHHHWSQEANGHRRCVTCNRANAARQQKFRASPVEPSNPRPVTSLRGGPADGSTGAPRGTSGLVGQARG